MADMFVLLGLSTVLALFPLFHFFIELPLTYKKNDPRRYGAEPNGITDSTRAIQKAINKTNLVIIPAGNYVISRTLMVKANCGIAGEGQGTTWIKS